MKEASACGARLLRALRPAALIALAILALPMTGCRQQQQQAQPSTIIDGFHVHLLAWIDENASCQQKTIDLLRSLEETWPARLEVGIVDIGSAAGRERWEEAGFDAMAIQIDGNTTVSWGEGDSRRTVTFMHPAGFAWTHDDLRAAVQAALRGGLRAADPGEAEGVRLMDVQIRGQSVRVGDEGVETGQLIIREQIVLEVTEPHEQLSPGQRVTAAAGALAEVLQKSFTPNKLSLSREPYGVVVMAGMTPVLVATEADVAAEKITREQLAERWLRAIRQVLIDAALHRSAAPEPEPEPPQAPPENPVDDLSNPLEPARP
ncbi:MAG: hypothetical protein ACOC7J_00920 [Armatimonadota bacterium]